MAIKLINVANIFYELVSFSRLSVECRYFTVVIGHKLSFIEFLNVKRLTVD